MSCLPHPARQRFGKIPARAAAAYAIRVSDDVELRGRITDDDIPGNLLRRRRVKKLPAALRRALLEAGFAVSPTAPAGRPELVATLTANLDLVPEQSWDYTGRKYTFEGDTTLVIERSGHRVESIAVHLPLCDGQPILDPPWRGPRFIDWQSYPDELARAFVEALERSPAMAHVGDEPSKPKVATKPVAPVHLAAATMDELDAMTADEAPKELAKAERELSAAKMTESKRLDLSKAANEAGEPAKAAVRPEEGAVRSDPGTVRAELGAAKADALELALRAGPVESRVTPDPDAIAVLGIEDPGHSFPPEVLTELGDYLAIKVTEVLGRPVVPGEGLREQLVAEKSRAYKDCVDEGCQIPLGHAHAARKSIASRLIRVGGTCALTIALYDLETELAERATSVRTDCHERSVLEGIDRVLARFGQGAQSADLADPVLSARPAAGDDAIPAAEPSDVLRGGLARQLTAEVKRPALEVPPFGARFEVERGALARSTLDLPGLPDDGGRERPSGGGLTEVPDTSVAISLPASALRLGVESRVPVKVALSAPGADLSERPFIDLALVLDVSSSMASEGRLQKTKTAAALVARYLRAEDSLAIVAFSGAPRIVLPSSHVSGRTSIPEVLAPLEAGGRANLGAAVQAAVRELGSTLRGRAVRSLVVVTDVSSDGGNDARALGRIAAGVARSGVALTIVGLGRDVDEPLLRSMASLAGGRYLSARSAEVLPDLLAHEVAALAAISMGDVAVELHPTAGVSVASTAGLGAPREPGLTWVAGSLASAEERDLEVDLRVVCREPGPLALGLLRVRYRDWTSGGKLVTRETELGARCTAR